MRKPVIAGNWKMHMTCAQTRDWLSTFLPLIAETPDDRHVVVAPPFTAISTMAEASSGSRVQISSQNVHWEGQGAFTAEISPAMLEEHGVPPTCAIERLLKQLLAVHGATRDANLGFGEQLRLAAEEGGA